MLDSKEDRTNGKIKFISLYLRKSRKNITIMTDRVKKNYNNIGINKNTHQKYGKY